MSKYKTGLVGEVEDIACQIYIDDFPRLTLHGFVDDFGNRLEDEEDIQILADKIADILNKNL